MRREALARICWGGSKDLPIQSIFALHLSGVSSLLGSINFILVILHTNIIFSYYTLFILELKSRVYHFPTHPTSGNWPCCTRFHHELIQEKAVNVERRQYWATLLADHPTSSSLPRGEGSSSSLDPWFLTGITDAEGSFLVFVRKESANRTGWRVEARFAIGLHIKDYELLSLIQSSFGGVGCIEHYKDMATFRVTKIEHLIQIIIPHFDKYSLVTKKNTDFELFKRVVDLIFHKKPLTSEGLQAIVNLKSRLNLGLKDELKKAFPGTTLSAKVYPFNATPEAEIKNPYWLAGFTSGDGNFSVSINKSSSNKLGFKVALRYHLYQHDRDEKFMRSLIKYLGCGAVYSAHDNVLVFVVSKFDYIVDIIIPMFKLHPIFGEKTKDFSDWVKVSELMKKGEHLNIDGFTQILNIRASMNKGRIDRKEEQLQQIISEVVNPSGENMNLDWLYMYNRDKSILYHSTKNVKEFSEYLKIYKAVLDKHLANGTYYLGKYSFSRELSQSVLEFKNLSLLELSLMLEKDRKTKYS